MTPTETCERMVNSPKWKFWGPVVGAILSALIAGTATVAVPVAVRQLDEAEASGQLRQRMESFEGRLGAVEERQDEDRTALLRELRALGSRLGRIDQRLSRIEGRLGERGGG